jgi:crotonobetaine/carnitine-CoA ligase
MTSTVPAARSPLTMMASGRNVPWLLERRAQERAHHDFLVWEPAEGPPEHWSYARFLQEVREVADGLRRRGIEPGDTIVVHLENCPEFLIAWFACTYLGAVPVCTNTRSAGPELRYFGEHSRAVAAITQPKFASMVGSVLPGLRWVAVTPTDSGVTPVDRPGRGDTFDALRGDAASTSPADVAPLAPAWIQYTSGTTSLPKAVVLTHANALWTAKVSAAHEGLTADDVHLVHLPLFHVNALAYSTLTTLWMGATAVLMPGFSASRFWDAALRNRCTWTSMIPFAVRVLSERDVPAEHQFRYWGYGFTSPVDDARFGIRTLGWYGMTETVSHPVMDEPMNAGVPGHMGRPMPEYEVAVLRDDGTPVEVGETGGIFVRGVPGVSLFAGYLHDEEATAATVDEEGWLRTGDLVTLHESGYMQFADRAKDMLKIGGENVAASEIERVIMGVPGVLEVAVVGAPHPMLDEVPVAFVIGAEPAGEIEQAVLSTCRQQLADFKVPRQVRVVDEMPRSTLNKIAKAQLRQSLRASAEAAAGAPSRS